MNNVAIDSKLTYGTGVPTVECTSTGSIDTVVGSTDPFSHSPFLVLDGARRALKDESLPVIFTWHR
jgi:hypothetical protein